MCCASITTATPRGLRVFWMQFFMSFVNLSCTCSLLEKASTTRAILLSLDRNDILKKDAYFGRTVMALINGCLFHFPQIKPEMEDYKFIQTRISQQYINQYNAIYGIA